jgi:hypothetical protein
MMEWSKDCTLSKLNAHSIIKMFRYYKVDDIARVGTPLVDIDVGDKNVVEDDVDELGQESEKNG